MLHIYWQSATVIRIHRPSENWKIGDRIIGIAHREIVWENYILLSRRLLKSPRSFFFFHFSKIFIHILHLSRRAPLFPNTRVNGKCEIFPRWKIAHLIYDEGTQAWTATKPVQPPLSSINLSADPTPDRFSPFWKIGATDFNKVLCTPVSEPVNNRTSFHHSFFHLIEKPLLFFFLVSSPLIFDIFRFNPFDNNQSSNFSLSMDALSLDFNVFDFKYNSNSNKSIFFCTIYLLQDFINRYPFKLIYLTRIHIDIFLNVILDRENNVNFRHLDLSGIFGYRFEMIIVSFHEYWLSFVSRLEISARAI